MSYQLYKYEIPENLKFFECKVQRDFVFAYGLSTINQFVKLVKVPVGLYQNNEFKKIITVTKNNNQINLFSKYYPQNRSYKTTCPIYWVSNKAGDKGYNKNGTWSSNSKNWTYYFSTDAISYPTPSIQYTILSTNCSIKSLLNDNVVLPLSGIKSFCYNELNMYPSVLTSTIEISSHISSVLSNILSGNLKKILSGTVASSLIFDPITGKIPVTLSTQFQSFQSNASDYSSINLTLAGGTNGEKVFNTYIKDEVGYITILDCKQQMHKIITLPFYQILNQTQTKTNLMNITAFSGVNCDIVCNNIFDIMYPESNACKNGQYTVYYIKKTSQINEYYNNIQQKFFTNINKATWYLSKDNAQIDLLTVPSAYRPVFISDEYKMVIKNLFIYGIEFPCSSFICENIKDYLIKK